MVPVERPKTYEKFASREKILKWKTGFRPWPNSEMAEQPLLLTMHAEAYPTHSAFNIN
jgi:hypothetical protein